MRFAPDYRSAVELDILVTVSIFYSTSPKFKRMGECGMWRGDDPLARYFCVRTTKYFYTMWLDFAWMRIADVLFVLPILVKFASPEDSSYKIEKHLLNETSVYSLIQVIFLFFSFLTMHVAIFYNKSHSFSVQIVFQNGCAYHYHCLQNDRQLVQGIDQFHGGQNTTDFADQNSPTPRNVTSKIHHAIRE